MAAEASPSGPDDFRPFVESPLWTLQRQYFAGRGQQAWSSGEVPHYVTSNPVVAAAYAEVLVAFRQERLRRDPEEPALWILELGAGSGRFAHHLLQQLAALCERQGLEAQGFRLVLSDFCEANLEAWTAHPCFQPFFANGQLDVARFDVMAPAPLVLRHSGETLGPGELRAPLVVIANYVLDSIPAELLRFSAGEVERGQVRLLGLPDVGGSAEPAEVEPENPDPDQAESAAQEPAAALLERLQLEYRLEPLADQPFADPGLAGLLADYQQLLEGLEEAWLLFPAPALRALDWLAALSCQGLLLLSADKGHHRLEEVLLARPPSLTLHGSFSLSVNYHALCSWAAAAGGVALAPEASTGGLHPIALLCLPQAEQHSATIAAWRRHMAAFSPSDYLSLSQLAHANAEQLSAPQLLAFLRLGQGDSQLLRRLVPRLRQLAPGLAEAHRRTLLECVAQVAQMHFPLDGAEQQELAEGIQPLLQALQAPPGEPHPDPRGWGELERELDWLAALVRARLERLLRSQQNDAIVPLIPSPPAWPVESAASPWAELLGELAEELNGELAMVRLARLALALLLAAQLKPETLDPLLLPNPELERRFSECGGVLREGGFEPTGDTLALLAAGHDLAGRAAVLRLLEEEGPLRRRGLLAPLEGDSPLKAVLRLKGPWLAWLAGGGPRPGEAPDTAAVAQRLETGMTWPELVLPVGTLRQLEEIEQHLEHQATLRERWGMGRRLRPGYRALFHGPPGTGKTLTAALLGQRLGLEVRRVDLSQAVSKYIGETEKNLAAVLERAERRQWLLVFDEAEALFGKRSETRDAHDRYANQEIAYLLQRLETFHGVVILATNLPRNMDEAFLRRFESVVYFPLPGPEQRLQLWREAFSPLAQLEVDLEAIAERHELSGGLILNVVRRVSLRAIAEGGRPIQEVDLLRAIRQEREKEGKGV